MTTERGETRRTVTPHPIDPLTGPPLALGGRVVVMDAAFHVEEDAVVYIATGSIVAVRARTQPPSFRGRFITQQETSHDSLLVLFLSSRHWTTVRV